MSKWMKEEFGLFGEVIEWARPNRAGGVALVKSSEGGWLVVMIDYYGDGEFGEPFEFEFSTEEAARDECSGLHSTPNWEAQAEYDEMHGTVNGQDPRIVAWQEEFGCEH